jgi:hypothetical protein
MDKGSKNIIYLFCHSVKFAHEIGVVVLCVAIPTYNLVEKSDRFTGQNVILKQEIVKAGIKCVTIECFEINNLTVFNYEEYEQVYQFVWQCISYFDKYQV